MGGTRYVTLETLADRTEAWLAAVRPYARRQPDLGLKRAALLVVDVQRHFAGVESHAYLPALDAVLPNISRLVALFQQADRPVVCTRHGRLPESPEDQMTRWWGGSVTVGEPAHALVPELEAAGVTRVLDKERYSAFHGTDLSAWLSRHGCDAVVICGVMTHLCCESSARDAFMEDLRVCLVADATASRDEELHLGALRAMTHGVAVIRSTSQVAATLQGRPARVEHRAASSDLPQALELAVIGAGPAGLAAAIQATRAGVSTALLDKGSVGGWALTARMIENYPGFPGGISGRSLMAKVESQASQWGIRALPLEVQRVAASTSGQGGLELQVRGGGGLLARAVILATGTHGRTLPEVPTTHSRIVHRADRLPPQDGLALVVVGGGEAALDQALYARSRLGHQVTVLVRDGAGAGAMPLLRRRCQEAGVRMEDGVHLLGAVPTGDADLPLELELQRASTTETRRVGALLICVGKVPRLPHLPGEVLLDPNGVPRCDLLGRTSLPGLYLAGDLRRGRYRQVVVASADGVLAAMHATRYLKGGSWTEE